MASPCFLASSIPDVSSYKVRELLYELPGVSCACSREPLLDDLDGLDGQGEVGGDSNRLFVGDGATRIGRKGALRLPARGHAFTSIVGKGEEMGVRRAQINFFVPRLVALLTDCKG